MGGKHEKSQQSMDRKRKSLYQFSLTTDMRGVETSTLSFKKITKWYLKILGDYLMSPF
jgi:hypothetical protein